MPRYVATLKTSTVTNNWIVVTSLGKTTFKKTNLMGKYPSTGRKRKSPFSFREDFHDIHFQWYGLWVMGYGLRLCAKLDEFKATIVQILFIEFFLYVTAVI
jgi:hypothetical protein